MKNRLLFSHKIGKETYGILETAHYPERYYAGMIRKDEKFDEWVHLLSGAKHFFKTVDEAVSALAAVMKEKAK